MESLMHFMIIGSGAVGGYFGAKLAQHGKQVTFIARNEHLSAMKTHGLEVKSINGDFHLKTLTVQQNTEGVKNVDVVILAVKSFQLREAVELISPVLNDATRIIPLLNGVDATNQLIDAGIAQQHIYGGLAKIISKVSSPGVISHTGAEPHITMGMLNLSCAQQEIERFEQITQCIKSCQISLRTTKSISIALWRKFIFVAAWGAIAATENKTIGELRSLPNRNTLVQVIIEYINIAKAHGVEIPDNIAQETMTFIDALPKASKTSMQRDIEQGNKSEVDSLVSYPYELAKRYNLTTPILLHCYQTLGKDSVS